MIGVGGVGLVLIIQNIPTINSRNEPTYINTQYIKNWMIQERKLNIVYLVILIVYQEGLPNDNKG